MTDDAVTSEGSQSKITQAAGVARPILFSSAMVRALMSGAKTQTRRLKNLEEINENPSQWRFDGFMEDEGYLFADTTKDEPNGSHGLAIKCPYGKVGDQLWVRESFRYADEDLRLHPEIPVPVDYRADPMKASVGCDGFDTLPWRPSIYMPRWASRITLEITEVRVQRLQEISKEDVISEGLSAREGYPLADCHAGWHEPFATLWDSINGKRPGCSWSDNPFVWAISFCSYNKGRA